MLAIDMGSNTIVLESLASKGLMPSWARVGEVSSSTETQEITRLDASMARGRTLKDNCEAKFLLGHPYHQ